MAQALAQLVIFAANSSIRGALVREGVLAPLLEQSSVPPQSDALGEEALGVEALGAWALGLAGVGCGRAVRGCAGR